MIRINKKLKRKNPLVDINLFLSKLKPSENIKFEKISQGGFGETYRFYLDNSKKLPNNKTLHSGTYLVKRQLHTKLTISEIKNLELLSKYGLIPKIYYIDERYQIMDYIKSNNLFDLTSTKKISDKQGLIILEKIKKLVKNWHDLGFCHGDLRNFKNYLITPANKIYIIDPATHYKCDFNKDLRDLEYIENVFTGEWEDWEDSNQSYDESYNEDEGEEDEDY